MSKNIEKRNRIVYVDPNDVRGEIKGEPLTPDYTEFCLWCNLVVEKSSRLKNQLNGSSANDLFAISFDMTKADNGNEYVSFMTGKDADNYNFLTTDYTNIDFDEIKKRNIIEGLQIESININFTNYQTPMITIKFIDIRGGGFFGREEATHNEYGKLSNLETDENSNKFDNFFGCFVSFPYPRFRLQVKGFYGRAVTYQLTCSSFNGSFNSATGNFEITVQFIGYEYGILGDIPFDLIVAAPLTATGSKYWEDQVANMDKNGWALDKDKTEAPCKLFDFYNKISGAIQNTDEGNLDDIVVDENLNTIISTAHKQIAELTQISDCIRLFKEEMKKNVTEYSEIINVKEDVLILYNSNEVLKITNSMVEKYNNLVNLIVKYVSTYKGIDSDITTYLIPNVGDDGSWYDWEIGKDILFTSFLTEKGGKKVICALNSSDKIANKGLTDETSCYGVKLYKIYCDDKYSISESASKLIFEQISSKDINKVRYASVIDFACATNKINARITELKLSIDQYKHDLNDVSKKTIKEIVGFTPYIGRYFKVVMCHLETFVYLFNQCARAIDEEILDDKKLRTPEKLGIKNMTDETDVPSDVYKQIPPFPSVYKKHMTDIEANELLNNGKNIVADAWIGDFKGEWQEKKLVDELYKALQRIAEARTIEEVEVNSNNGEKYRSGFIGVIPIDFYLKIPSYAYTSKDGAFLYAALRAELALQVMQENSSSALLPGDTASKLGMLDAYNFIKQRNGDTIFKILGGITNLEEEIKNTVVYTSDFKSKNKKLFEFTKVHNGRQPVFINNNGYEYSYMCNDDDGVKYIPLDDISTLNKNNGFSNFYEYKNGKDFKLKNLYSDKYLAIDNDTIESDEYTNTHFFDIIWDSDTFNELISLYKSNLLDGFMIADKSGKDFKDVFYRHWMVKPEHVNNYYKGNSIKNYKSYDEYGVDVSRATNRDNTKHNDDREFTKNFIKKVIN